MLNTYCNLQYFVHIDRSFYFLGKFFPHRIYTLAKQTRNLCSHQPILMFKLEKVQYFEAISVLCITTILKQFYAKFITLNLKYKRCP